VVHDKKLLKIKIWKCSACDVTAVRSLTLNQMVKISISSVLDKSHGVVYTAVSFKLFLRYIQISDALLCW